MRAVGIDRYRPDGHAAGLEAVRGSQTVTEVVTTERG
jgi:hypothetical protein